MPIVEQGVFEIVGINQQVDTDRYAESVSTAIVSGPLDGELFAMALFSTETGTGAVQKPSGRIIVFDADPAVLTNATAITAAQHLTILGIVEILGTDWHSDANGATVFKSVAIPFHSVANLYFTFFNTGSAFNDVAGDDEKLEGNFWYHDNP